MTLPLMRSSVDQDAQLRWPDGPVCPSCGVADMAETPRQRPVSDQPIGEPAPPEPEDSERSRFARLAKKFVRISKKEIDEKAEEWKRERRRGR